MKFEWNQTSVCCVHLNAWTRFLQKSVNTSYLNLKTDWVHRPYQFNLIHHDYRYTHSIDSLSVAIREFQPTCVPQIEQSERKRNSESWPNESNAELFRVFLLCGCDFVVEWSVTVKKYKQRTYEKKNIEASAPQNRLALNLFSLFLFFSSK